MDITILLKISGLILLIFIIVLIPVFLGQWYGNYYRIRTAGLQDTPVSTVVAAAFGTLAFLLAFIFQIAAGRYAERKELLLEEVTNIRTTYLRAGLLQEPFCSDTRKLMIEYVDLRIKIGKDTTGLNYALTRSQVILDTLWNYCEKLSELDRSSEIYALYTTSINDLVDNFNHRVTMTFEYRIPIVIYWIVLTVLFFSMLALGYQFGISGKGGIRINAVLALIFAMIMFLIYSLDRPEAGLAKIDQKPMITLQRQLNDMQTKTNN
jgi:hypothetical protein